MQRAETKSPGKAGLRGPSEALRARRVAWMMAFLALSIFGGAIGVVTSHLREKIRQQIAGRDGEILYAVALMQQFEADPELAFLSSVEEPEVQLEILLKTSRLKGVIAARLFDPSGRFVGSIPVHVTEAEVPLDEVERLASLEVVSRFIPEGDLSELFLQVEVADKPALAPLLDVKIPINPKDEDRLVGIAQFIIDGQSIGGEFAALDRHLILQAAAAFTVGGVLILLALNHATRRLRRANRLLAGRTAELARANQELVLASKVSAVGAVTSHLIHGLKGPLFGLRNLVSQRRDDGEPDDQEWRLAAASAQQMHSMVDSVTRMLSDDSELVEYSVTFADLGEVIENKWRPVARERGIDFHARIQAQGAVTNRVGHLVLMILENLLENAVQAGAGRVALEVHAEADWIHWEVEDNGPGVPESAREDLFTACRSTKPGGNGIGLAISKQLAQHLGGKLELAQTGNNGSRFALRLPASLLAPEERLLTEA